MSIYFLSLQPFENNMTMSKKRVLFITQEMNPYTALGEVSDFVRKLPQKTVEKGFEIRVLMPKFGSINERRHRLHEVVRLSGMNIIVDDEDYPLIIKVASLPGARLQVYFLDNEEFFRRKFVFHDKDEKVFEDNEDRMVFFCKGALETVKKFGWAPDIIHCHGWMTSLVPKYIKTVYQKDPIFQDSKIVYSLYNNDLSGTFSEQFLEKAAINDLGAEQLTEYMSDGKATLAKGVLNHIDILVEGSESFDEDVKALIESSEARVLPYIEDIDESVMQCVELYKEITAEEEEEEG